jgi:predicted small secreted protein
MSVVAWRCVAIQHWLKWQMFFHSSRCSVLKIFAIVAAVLTLTACANGNGGAGSGSISAYGTIDEGVSIKGK